MPWVCATVIRSWRLTVNEVDNFYAIIPDILLNDRQVITVDRNGEIIDIPVKREYIQILLKNPDIIDARIPFGPFVISEVADESPAAAAGLAAGDEILALTAIRFHGMMSSSPTLLRARRNR
jgi:regulator of sigma E protease